MSCVLTGPMAAHLAAKISQGLDRGRKIILVSHSQGNHLAGEALDLLATTEKPARLKSVGAVMLTSEVSEMVPPIMSANVSNLILDGDFSQLTSFQSGPFSRQFVEDGLVLIRTGLSHSLNAYIKGSGQAIRESFRSIEKRLKVPEPKEPIPIRQPK